MSDLQKKMVCNDAQYLLIVFPLFSLMNINIGCTLLQVLHFILITVISHYSILFFWVAKEIELYPCFRVLLLFFHIGSFIDFFYIFPLALQGRQWV